MSAVGRVASVGGALIFAATIDGCRSPTQISLEVFSEVPCDQFKGLTIAVGRLHEVESKPATVVTETSICRPDSQRLGSLVITPSGAKDEEVTIKVVVGVTKAAVLCERPNYEGCIVARRALRFVPHEPLDLPVNMSARCIGQPCTDDTTCVQGLCVPAVIPDSTQCKGSGCDEKALAAGYGSDAGVEVGPDAVPDATTDAPLETSPDASPDVLADGDAGPIPGHVLALSVGVDYGCAIITGGALKCWGVNIFGQVGDGTTISRGAPVDAAKSIGAVSAVSLGEEITCAIAADETVRCWGNNEYSACGVAPSFGPTAPQTVSGVAGAVEVRAGFRHACARLDDGTVKCWGSAGDGGLGNGDLTSTATLATTVPVTGAVQITPTCARLGSGEVYCWGAGLATPSKVPDLTAKAIDIQDATDGNVLIVLEGGDVVRARRDGTGWVVHPEAIGAKIGPARRAVGRFDHTWVLLADGSVYTYDSYGDPAPKMVPGLGPGTVSDIASGGSDDYGQGLQCVSMTSGAVKCWGSDLFGGLGIGRPEFFTTPQRIPGLSGVARVHRFDATWSAAAAAVHTDGTISAWGSSRALGLDRVATPTKMTLLGANDADLIMGQDMEHAYVVKKTGAVADFRAASADATPGLSDSAFGDFTSMVLGAEWELGVRTGGQLEFWSLGGAANSDGIFGKGDLTPRAKDTVTELTFASTPLGVVGYANAFGSGDSTLCAWLADGTVSCWGDNKNGLCGSATSGTRFATPQTIPFAAPKPKIVSTSVAHYHACAVDDVHRVWCWGDNGSGQLGVASPATANVPIQVPGISTAVGVSCWRSTSCVWLLDRTALCWGSNDYAELGDGTVVGRSTPRPVVGLGDVVSMDAECAVHGSGGVSCWGDSYTGEVGTGINGDVKTPTVVLGL